ncbi:MAG: DUF4296 domain-containing protein [Sphingobacteriales bacterium]|nr:MAG: DUF4296 domain-containing protein [Sphingobacteriales bacterium]
MFCVSVTSCKNNSKKIISEKNIVPLMVDLLLLESNYSLVNVQAYNTESKMMDSLYTSILKKHQTDSIQFRKTIDYYSNHPEKYLEMMEKVKNKLNTIDSLTIIKYGKNGIEPVSAVNPLDIQKAIKDSMRMKRKEELLKNIRDNNLK